MHGHGHLPERLLGIGTQGAKRHFQTSCLVRSDVVFIQRQRRVVCDNDFPVVVFGLRKLDRGLEEGHLGEVWNVHVLQFGVGIVIVWLDLQKHEASVEGEALSRQGALRDLCRSQGLNRVYVQLSPGVNREFSRSILPNLPG